MLQRRFLPAFVLLASIVPASASSGGSRARAWRLEADQATAAFGHSVAGGCDVNGDGYDDVIVGANGYDNGEADEGRAFAYHGSAQGFRPEASWTAESDQPQAFFGQSVGCAGDVNGDGYDDVVVGAHGYDGAQFDEGRIYLFYGSATGLSAVPAWTAESGQGFADLGVAVGGAGDVNGDGFDDIIAGAYLWEGGQDNEGAAFVYLGSPGGPGSTPDWIAESDEVFAFFGVAVGTAGDVNGDGYDDVIVGARNFGDGGGAFVYHGSASGLATTPSWMAVQDQVEAFLGTSVGTAGDVNGDGYDDIIVGAQFYDDGELDEGAAFVYHGSSAGLSTTPSWTGEGNQVGATFGFSVARAGDLDGDGYSDVVVGAQSYDHGQFNEGAAFVYYGSSAGLSATAGFGIESDQPGAAMGNSVASAGDVNGDGYDDFIVGAWFYSRGEVQEGLAAIVRGRARD